MAIHYDRYTCGRCGYTLVYQESAVEKESKTKGGKVCVLSLFSI